ncbi:hypothetical protein BV898_17396 [Hypsibius exemplaris]|uniref:Uncharacterized protein n=1 Tax=Hypsibius exemplaris TaxID=2072580 RepID=A0A9X6RMF1_HYPEX|nr:hypothetical protein BV898_17396 [Hypsibius exemplaris]
MSGVVERHEVRVSYPESTMGDDVTTSSPITRGRSGQDLATHRSERSGQVQRWRETDACSHAGRRRQGHDGRGPVNHNRRRRVIHQSDPSGRPSAMVDAVWSVTWNHQRRIERGALPRRRYRGNTAANPTTRGFGQSSPLRTMSRPVRPGGNKPEVNRPWQPI